MPIDKEVEKFPPQIQTRVPEVYYCNISTILLFQKWLVQE